MNRHTQALEDMIRVYFTDFLDLVEPGLAASLAPRGIHFPGRAELADWPDDELRDLGLLAELIDGRGEALPIVIQVEERAGDRTRLEDRLLSAFLRLAVNGHQPVRLIVVQLRGGRPGVHLEWIVDEVDGEELLRVPYLVFGLEGCRLERYCRQPSPLLWALSYFTRPHPETRTPVRGRLRRLAGLSC